MVQQQPIPEPESQQSLDVVVERTPRQSVMIGDDIEIVVLHAGSGSARLGITVPEGVNVEVGEVRLRRKS